jgi:peptide-methionine (S)-S-oxide reductase
MMFSIPKFSEPHFFFRVARLSLFALLGLGVVLWQLPALAEKSVTVIPAPVIDEPATPGIETAVFAGGCFWGVQGVFQHVDGVTQALSGYSGGDSVTAYYPIVSTGETGHAESVRVTFDPHAITYGKLLQIYFSVAHDPTELNRQGPDEGTQYRSALFPENPDQKRIAEAYIAQLNAAGVFAKPIATRIEPFKAFYPAEHYHQNYLTLNPYNPYIAINDVPKVAALKKLFPSLYRDNPVLVQTASN